MPLNANELMEALLNLPPLRPGADFFEGESPSVLCLDLLLNQRVGVERATAATLALHHHFGSPTPRFIQSVPAATRWPYIGIELRTPAKSLFKLIQGRLTEIGNSAQTPISELGDPAVGALASLERYYNRDNRYFDPLRRSEISPEIIRSLNKDDFKRITGQNFPKATVALQLASVAAILEMRRSNIKPDRLMLKRLPRVGDETAATLLVYLFKQPAIICDDYLKRILYRHFVMNFPNPSRLNLERLLEPVTQDQAHRLHARSTELGVLYCHSKTPACGTCPLQHLPHQA